MKILKNIPLGIIIRTVGFFLVGMVGGIFAEQVFWPYFVERPLFEKYGLEQPPVYVTERKEIYIQENTALENAVEEAEKVVIGVKTKTSAGKIIEGSGLIVSSDGTVVTLADLVPQGSTFYFYINDTAVPYQILKRDLKENLVFLKVEGNNLYTAGFADLGKIKLGKRVFMIGSIFSTSTPEKIVNEGIIKTFNEDMIETNIIQKEGADGSVLFDIEGNIVGLNDLDKEGNMFTIPVSKIKTFIGM